MAIEITRDEEPRNSPKSEFVAKLEDRWSKGNFVCVGLDPRYGQIPEVVSKGVSVGEAIYIFNREIVDATHDLVCAYKPNFAFYDVCGLEGLQALVRTVKYIQAQYPGIPVILDGKKVELVGEANPASLKAAFTVFGADAITMDPYPGFTPSLVFTTQRNKGIIFLCRTSNPSAGDLQDQQVDYPDHGRIPVYQAVAYLVVEKWNKGGNCGLVVGATYPEELAEIREIAPYLPFLIVGIGAQGGDVREAVEAGRDPNRTGMIIGSSRGIIFASPEADFAQAARIKTEELRGLINKYR